MCDRPSRTLLETIRSEWIAESGTTPPGNGADEARWNQPIDAKACMTPQEQAAYASADDQGKIKAQPFQGDSHPAPILRG
jgi:hypothetical protein